MAGRGVGLNRVVAENIYTEKGLRCRFPRRIGICVPYTGCENIYMLKLRRCVYVRIWFGVIDPVIVDFLDRNAI